MPNEIGRLGGVRHEARRRTIVHVGDDDHGLRMLEESVRQFGEGQPDILHADLLADDYPGDVAETLMHVLHDLRQDRAVTHTRIEEMQCRTTRLDVGQLGADPFGDRRFLAARRDEEEILLAIVIEPEGAHLALGLCRLGALIHCAPQSLPDGRPWIWTKRPPAASRIRVADNSRSESVQRAHSRTAPAWSAAANSSLCCPAV